MQFHSVQKKVGLSGMVGLVPKWVRLAPNGTNPGLFQIRFQCIWRTAPNALKSDLKKPGICPIWGQSDPLWGQTYHPCVRHTAKSGCDWYRIVEIWNSFISQISRDISSFWDDLQPSVYDLLFTTVNIRPSLRHPSRDL